MSGSAPRFENRVRIQGTLTLTSDLYLGDGLTDRRQQLQGDEQVEVATIVTDCDGMPTIPATSLRGVLREYLETRLAPPQLIHDVFGKASESNSVNRDDLNEAEMGHGGRVEFAYATLVGLKLKPVTSTHVGINRKTRTAADRILFGSDYVPRDTQFEVRLTGFNLKDEHIGLLLQGFHGFNDKHHPIRLGANHADFCGQAEWKTTLIQKIDAAAVREWVQAPQPWNVLSTKPKNVPYSEDEYRNKITLATPKQSIVEVMLHFHTPLLVNDPNAIRPKKPNNQEEGNHPHHSPRRLPNGQVYLPASSFRGAFRSQAERIVRTLNPDRAKDPNDGNMASHADESDLVKALFGHAGQRAKLSISDFVPVEKLQEVAKQEGEVQEFVAIDRFTGGGADALKFNANRVNARLTLSGRITLQSDDPVSLGLLVLTLRDLREGDITFGWGSSKGYGHCTAELGDFKTLFGLPVEQLKAAVTAFRNKVQESTRDGTQ